MSNDIVRFCLLGCGRVSRKHAESLSDYVDNAELVSVCDLKKDRAQALAAEYGVSCYTDFNDMLERETCDAVCVLTESGNHASHCIEVASIPHADACINFDNSFRSCTSK